jgi:hypothetical protein
MNAYRITVRDEDGKLSQRETEAASLHMAIERADELYDVVKIEHIDWSTGELLSGFYNK